MAVHRNRVIYQSEALFISPDSTGYHFTGSAIPNAEVPSDYDSIASFGPGPFGLMTPPISSKQVLGGTASSPATNSRGNLVGWKTGDEWPEWCPDGDPGAEAEFNGQADIDNADEAYIITAGKVGSAANVTVNGDGTNSTKELLEAAVLGFNFVFSDGNKELVPDNGSSFAFTGGINHVDASNTFQAITVTVDSDVTRATGGTEGEAFSITYNDTAGATIDAVLDPTDATSLIVTYDSTASHTDADVAAKINGVTGFSSTAITSSAVLASGGQVKTNFANGVNGDFATFDGDLPVESKSLDVHIRAVNKGIAANGIEFTGDDAKDIDNFVATHNAVAGNSQLEVVLGGNHVLNTDEKIKLTGGSNGCAKSHGTIIKQLKRIQTANYGFTVNRQDINQFGHLSRLDSLVIEAPTVNLDFSYYLLDGYNERHLEMITDGVTNALAAGFSPELYQAGSNFFILTMPEAGDAVVGDVKSNKAGNEDLKSVISLGNGYVTDYSVDIAVGSIPTASVTVEGMNIKSDIGETGNDLPAIAMYDGSFVSDAWDKDSDGNRVAKEKGCTGLYSLPPATSGYDGCGDVSALRPGDVVLDLEDGGLFSSQQSGLTSSPTVGSAHVQSVSLSIPQARSALGRLGSTFGFSKTLDVPINVTLSVSATMADIKEANMGDLLCGCDKIDATISMYDPECISCTTKEEGLALQFKLRGARLESENFTSTIGDNKSVELTFVTQIGGIDDLANGFFISGKEASEASVMGQPPAWTGMNGEENIPSGAFIGYRA